MYWIVSGQPVGTLVRNCNVVGVVLNDRPHRWQLPTRCRQRMLVQVTLTSDSLLVVHPKTKIDVSNSPTKLNLERVPLLVREPSCLQQVLENGEFGARWRPDQEVRVFLVDSVLDLALDSVATQVVARVEVKRRSRH